MKRLLILIPIFLLTSCEATFSVGYTTKDGEEINLGFTTPKAKQVVKIEASSK